MGNYSNCDYNNHKFARDDPNSNFYRSMLVRADGSGLNFNGSNFKEADLRICEMQKARMQNCDFSDATLGSGDFRRASLQASNFYNTDLSRARLRGANLTGACFDGAKLSGTDFREADLTSAEFRGVDLSVSKGLTQEQLDSAKGDSSVILPEGLTRPAHWQDLAPPDDES